MVISVAGNHDIAGHGHDIRSVDPFCPVLALIVDIAGDMAIEADREDRHPPLELPGRTVTQPVIRGLDLIAVDQLLVEKPVLIANAVAIGRNLQGGDRIHETGGQAAEASVAKSRLLFLVADLGHIIAQGLNRLFGIIHDPEIDQAVAE